MSLVRHDGHPDRRAERRRRGDVDGLRVRPGQRRPASRPTCSTCRRWSASREELIKLGGDAAALADSPLLFPDDDDQGPAARVRRPARRARPGDHRPLRHDHGRLSDGRPPPPTTASLRDGPVRAVPDVAARAAVPVPVLHRPARHAAQDRPVGASRERQHERRVPRGSGATSRTAFTEFGDAARGGRSPTPAIATVLCVLHRLPDRLLHRLQGREVGATSCSGW